MSDEYCELILKYDARKMPPTSLVFFMRELQARCDKFTPPIKFTVVTKPRGEEE